jgi:hypothetical protein
MGCLDPRATQDLGALERAAFLDLRIAHVIAACHMTALEIGYSARSRADLGALLAVRSGNGHRRAGLAVVT